MQSGLAVVTVRMHGLPESVMPPLSPHVIFVFFAVGGYPESSMMNVERMGNKEKGKKRKTTTTRMISIVVCAFRRGSSVNTKLNAYRVMPESSNINKQTQSVNCHNGNTKAR